MSTKPSSSSSVKSCLSSGVKPAVFVFVLGFFKSARRIHTCLYTKGTQTQIVCSETKNVHIENVTLVSSKVPISLWATLRSPERMTGFLRSSFFMYSLRSLSQSSLYESLLRPSPALGTSIYVHRAQNNSRNLK